ncbi:MAG TPA: hypothetical protein VGR02_21355 [Thermoanaerobaculia bacterium]|jgi:hypothetical protein|nr:hypothetical protein [Thermoanaerobaculia bacterium]
MAALILTLGVAGLAGAQEQQAAPPDFSRDRLRQILTVDEAPERAGRVEFLPGAIVFRALGMRWRFNAFAMPLAGSVRTTTGFNVDPFALTGTEIAQTPRTWVSRRAVNAELKRIDRTERERGKIKVNP